MSKNRHKRKVSHILIYTTDAVDADTKQVRIHPWVLAGVTLIVCCVLGAVIGYAVYEGELWGRIREHDASQNAALIAAQDEKDALQEKIDEQDAKIEMHYHTGPDAADCGAAGTDCRAECPHGLSADRFCLHDRYYGRRPYGRVYGYGRKYGCSCRQGRCYGSGRG